jgi:hypothetical protein
LDRERFAVAESVATPGDLADAEDVILLPAAKTKPSADVKADAKSPLKTAAPPIPTAKKPAPEQMEFPDEPAPPKSILNWPPSIPLPN